MTHINFRCVRCGRTGDRTECYVPQPGRVPDFVDVCPACKSTDIDILNARYQPPPPPSEKPS
jgi:hypothetical protein